MLTAVQVFIVHFQCSYIKSWMKKCTCFYRNVQKESIILEVCGRMPAVPIQGTQRHFQKRYHGV